MLDLNWRNPPSLRSPKRKGALDNAKARDKAALAKPAKGPKRHSVNREKSREASAKAAKCVEKETLAKAAHRRWLDAVRAYWRGETDEHP